MLKIILIFAFLFTLSNSELLIHKYMKPLSQEMIDSINSLNTTWKAGKNFEGLPLKYVKRILGVINDTSLPKLPVKRYHPEVQVPESFDAREIWPNCKSIGKILDQGGCDSSWAIAPVEVMSDRICIASNGQLQVDLSADDVISCCVYYGFGCNGGSPYLVWKYWADKGIVTGGIFDSNLGCRPYTIPPCEHHLNGTRLQCSLQQTPPCMEQCIMGYGKRYDDDKYFGNEAYSIAVDENRIKTEIYNNGPVVGIIMLYEDFYSYKSGVYQHINGDRVGQHSAKIIGWGVENKVPYWLVANSWNTDWGDKGYFKILRGTNECEIEGGISAGTPDFDRNSR